jgi:tRNA-specific 2-thiouridylase
MKALALFSGGLDSTLSMKLIKDQGIEVVAININTGFGSLHDRMKHMQNMCDQIGVELEVLDVRDAYLEEVLFEPRYGYGKNFNPCIDCHGFMFKATSELLKKYNASFMISGEVVGQRPMSQNKDSLSKVQKISLNEDLILRPLSAKLLPITKIESEGWVDREKLLDISGRSRSRQFEIAKEIGLIDFEPPAGGCLLTQPQFGNKMKDFIKYDKMQTQDIDTLKVGRHLRLPDGAKLIIGRNEEDNQKIEKIINNKYKKAVTIDAVGPTALLEKIASQKDIELAVSFIISYAKTQLNKKYQVDFGDIKISGQRLESRDIIKQYLIQ